MKELGGVGAVVLGGMLLLTIKVGPVEAGPEAARPAATPMGAIAAVTESPAEASPPLPEASSRSRLCVVAADPEGKARDEGKDPVRDPLELALKALEARAFTLALPPGASCL